MGPYAILVGAWSFLQVLADRLVPFAFGIIGVVVGARLEARNTRKRARRNAMLAVYPDLCRASRMAKQYADALIVERPWLRAWDDLGKQIAEKIWQVYGMAPLTGPVLRVMLDKTCPSWKERHVRLTRATKALHDEYSPSLTPILKRIREDNNASARADS